jgi:ribosomal protein S18 acetylase RimI-like enzyme
MDKAYRTRIMTREDVGMAIDWAAAEGWNPGLDDAETFRAADPSGFLLALVDDEPAASISLVKYGADCAFLGFYMVRPQFRGQGFGWRLWQDGMATAAGRQVGLDGVIAQQENYRKSGFTLAWRNVRYEGAGLAHDSSDRRVRPLQQVEWADVVAYDAAYFPADRSAFLHGWLRQPNAIVLGFVDAKRLQGYGLIRRCRVGWKIGPLFADDEVAAESLYVALAGQAAASEPVSLDIPEANTAALALTRRHGMRVVFETARMYTGAAPPRLPLERTYGITSFELG